MKNRIKNCFIYLFFILLFFYGNHHLSAQNCEIECTQMIANQNLEIDPPSGWPIQYGESGHSFNLGYVPYWYASHGSPHHCQDIGDGAWNCSFTNDPNGTEVNGLSIWWLSSFDNFSEGIFQDIELINDPFVTYHLFYKFQNMYYQNGINHFMKIKLASNLTNNENWGSSVFPQNIPHREIESVYINSEDIYEDCISFQMVENESFDQLWIHNDFPVDENGENEVAYTQWTTIDNLSLECTTDALVDAVTNINGNEVYFEAVNASTTSDFVSYEWDFGDGNGSIEASPTHTYNEFGTYLVCLKIIDEYGCCAEYCEEVVISEPSCDNLSSCRSIVGPVLISEIVSGSDPIPTQSITYQGMNVLEISDQCFSCLGELIIDIPIAFTNTEWFMDSGASIKQTSDLFLIQESELIACNYMWEGITVVENETTPAIILKNSLVKDAFKGIKLNNNTEIRSINTDYINNLYGIYMGNETYPISFVGNYLLGNTFNFEGSMLPPYAEQPLWEDRTIAGIKADKISLVSVGPYNDFINLTNGILSQKSGLNVRLSRFTINDVLSSNNYYVNKGISILNNSSISKIINNSFKNNLHGIVETQGMNGELKVKDNNFNIDNSVAYTGNYYYQGRITIGRNINGEIEIYNNDFLSDNIAIVHGLSVFDSPYNSLFVYNNDFTIQNAGSGSTGPYVFTFRGNTGESLVKDNQFHMDKPKIISIKNCPGMNFLNNEFSINENSNSDLQRLFALSNSPNGFFKANISNDFPNLFAIWPESISNTFCCNASYYDGRTFEYNGGLLNSSLYVNDIDGLSLHYGSIMGQQENNGNYWDISGSFAQISEDENFSITPGYIDNNKFIVDPNQSGNIPTQIQPGVWAEEWFKKTGTSNACSEYPECESVYDDFNGGSNGGGSSGPGGPPTENKKKEVVRNFVLTCKYLNDEVVNYSDLMEWNNLQYLYEYMDNYPQIQWQVLVDEYSSEILAVSCIDLITQEVIDWYDMEQDINDIYTMNEYETSIVEGSQALIDNYTDQLEDWYSMYPDSIDSEVFDYHNQIVLETNKIEAINAVLKARVETNAQTILGNLNRLKDDLPFLLDRKNVWTIKMKTIIKGNESLTQQEVADLYRISSLCPLEYGSAVYEAYGLLESCGFNVDEIDIENSCPEIVQPRGEHMVKGVNNMVYPNPSSGKVQVVIKDKQIDAFEIYNTLGQLVFAKELIKDISTYSIDLTRLEPGTYICKYLSDKNLRSSQKFYITR